MEVVYCVNVFAEELWKSCIVLMCLQKNYGSRVLC